MVFLFLATIYPFNCKFKYKIHHPSIMHSLFTMAIAVAGHINLRVVSKTENPDSVKNLVDNPVGGNKTTSDYINDGAEDSGGRGCGEGCPSCSTRRSPLLVWKPSLHALSHPLCSVSGTSKYASKIHMYSFNSRILYYHIQSYLFVFLHAALLLFLPPHCRMHFSWPSLRLVQ